jgi:hypothetical protein
MADLIITQLKSPFGEGDKQMKKKNELPIGEVVMFYDSEGKPTKVEFTPEKIVLQDPEFLKALKTIANKDDVKTLEENADLALAAYFNKLNEIEQADRMEYKIEKVVQKTPYKRKRSAGQELWCRVKYVLKKLSD